jgi:hypothetical protein
LERLATDSTASIFNRFEAIELLLRLAMGPRYRPADSSDVAASRHARIALSTAASFLNKTMTSNGNRSRIRLQAASLASLVAKCLAIQAKAYRVADERNPERQRDGLQ